MKVATTSPQHAYKPIRATRNVQNLSMASTLATKCRNIKVAKGGYNFADVQIGCYNVRSDRDPDNNCPEGHLTELK